MHNKQHFSEMFNFGPKHGCMFDIILLLMNLEPTLIVLIECTRAMLGRWGFINLGKV